MTSQRRTDEGILRGPQTTWKRLLHFGGGAGRKGLFQQEICLLQQCQTRGQNDTGLERGIEVWQGPAEELCGGDEGATGLTGELGRRRFAAGRAVQRIQRIEQGDETPGDALEAQGFGAGEGS